MTNLEFIKFCQNMLGAPYWFNTSCQKASKNLLMVNSMRYPEQYKEDKMAQCELDILNNEIVTDTIGLIKGYAWSEDPQKLALIRGTTENSIPRLDFKVCPDKGINALFTWATTQNIKWGDISTMPEVPGIVVSMNTRLAIYDGEGYVIEASREEGKVIRSPLDDSDWKFWYELPFIEYTEEIIPTDEINEPEEVKVYTIAVAANNVLFREEPRDDAKLFGIIYEKDKVEVYSDSTNKWLHVNYQRQEGYTNPDYFLVYPGVPDRVSKEEPKEMIKEMFGKKYITSINVGIRSAASPRATPYTTLLAGTEIFATGGVTERFYQVYANSKGYNYIGYVDKKYLMEVIEDGYDNEEKETQEEE